MGRDPKLKLTQTIVGIALKRTPDGNFAPKAPVRDHEVGGLLLVIGARTATWCVDYKPRGRREDGRRHSKVRMTLGDAAMMPLSDARTAARAIKVEVAQGRDPHAEKRAQKVKAIAERAIKATTLAEALEGYEKDMLKRREPSEATPEAGSPLRAEGCRQDGSRLPRHRPAGRRRGPQADQDDGRQRLRGSPCLRRSIALLQLDD